MGIGALSRVASAASKLSDTRVVVVDSTAGVVAGEVYDTIQAAITYAEGVSSEGDETNILIIRRAANYAETLTFADYVNLIGYGASKPIVEQPDGTANDLNGATCNASNLIFRIPAAMQTQVATWFTPAGGEAIVFNSVELDCLKAGAAAVDFVEDAIKNGGSNPGSTLIFNRCDFNLQNHKVFWQQRSGDWLEINDSTFSMDYGRGSASASTVTLLFTAQASSVAGRTFRGIIRRSTIAVDHQTDQQASAFVSLVISETTIPIDVDVIDSTITVTSGTGEAYVIDVPLGVSLHNYTLTNAGFTAAEGIATAAALANEKVTIVQN